MYITKNLVEKLGGEISVKSELLENSQNLSKITFKLLMPVKKHRRTSEDEMQSVTLIIDKRLELSTKYKKLLESNSNNVIVSKDLITALKIIQDKEPDLIIISDSFDNDLCDFCKQVRALTYNMRPVIVAMSKSADFNDRIKVLNSGADDFYLNP